MKRQRDLRTFGLTTLLCIGLFSASVALAQQGDQDSQRSDRGDQQQSNQIELPQFLQELDLSSDQESQIKQSLEQHNQKLRETWREFHTKHARVVELEAAWASAVRDSLSKDDQRKFDQKRMQDREMTQHSRSDSTSSRADEDRQADRQTDRERQRQDSEQTQAERAAAESSPKKSQNAQDRGEFGILLITTVSPEYYAQGTKQSAQQRQQCSQACQEYKQELSSVLQDLHRLHFELVGIEADRIQAIEEQLTEEQLTQLKENRQQPSEQAAETSSRQSRN